MKKIVIGLCIITIIQSLYVVWLNTKVYLNNKYIKALEQYTKAQIYKKDAQLYLMNTEYNNPEIHKLLADSCKINCINYKKIKYND